MGESGNSLVRYLVYLLRVRRVEYRIAEIPILLIPVLLTLSDAAALTTVTFWEGVLVFFFLFSVGDLVNCLADRDQDAIYKQHLTEAVYGLGLRSVIYQAVGSALAAVGLAALLSWQLDRWILLPCVVIGVVVAASYSLEPVRLKRRGLAQVFFFWLGLFALPMIFAALVVSASPPLGVYAFALAYGLLQTGVVLVNTAEDYPEDRQASVNTVIVSLGLRGGITLAAVLTVAGSLAVLSTLAMLSWQRGMWGTGTLALLPVCVACLWVSARVCLLRRALSGTTLDEGIQMVKRQARWVPAWITSVALGCLLAALVLFLWSPLQ